MPTIRQIVEQNDSRWGRLFDLVIQAMIVFSMVTFSLETLPDLSASTRRILYYCECVTVMLFSIEYLLRLAVAERKLAFVFSFFGLIDLLSILPFYLDGIDLRSIRAFRLLRLFRSFKFFRYSKAIRGFTARY